MRANVYIINNRESQKALGKRILDADFVKPLKIEVTEYGEKRNADQNALMWALLTG